MGTIDKIIIVVTIIAIGAIISFITFDLGQQVQESKNLKHDYCNLPLHNYIYCKGK